MGVTNRNGIRDAARLIQGGFLALLDKDLIDNANDPTGARFIKRAATVAGISRGVEL